MPVHWGCAGFDGARTLFIDICAAKKGGGGDAEDAGGTGCAGGSVML